MLGGWEIILILAVVLIFVRRQKSCRNWPRAGHGHQGFKKATREVTVLNGTTH